MPDPVPTPFDETDTLSALFLRQAERFGDRPVMWRDSGEEGFVPWSWTAIRDRALAAAAGLRDMGLKPGDRVMIVSENRPAFAVADFATLFAGGISVPTYTTNTVGDHRHILTDCGATVAFCSTPRHAEKLKRAAVEANRPLQIVVLDATPAQQDSGVSIIDAETLCQTDASRFSPHVASGADIACLIYTSGTGGAPKGVMLTHKGILHNCWGARNLLERTFPPGGPDTGHDVFLSILPLSHSYEHTAGLMLPIYLGAEIYYPAGLDGLAQTIAEVRPTFMTAVPRLLEVLKDRIERAVDRKGGLSARLFRLALSAGKRRLDGPLPVGLALADPLFDMLVRRKFRQRFGGRMKAFVSGGAPLNAEVGHFFQALGLTVCQGYGQTETSPVVSVNPPGRVKMHTVGPPLDGVAVRLGEAGEIQVQGPLVMRGYWNNEADTAAAFTEDGWLKTGDIGSFDEDGYLMITDRMKDIIVNSGGDNLSPQRVEGFLTLEPDIAQAMVAGDGRPHLVAAIVPSVDCLKRFIADRGLDIEPEAPDALEKINRDERLRKALHDEIGHAVARANDNLSVIEKVRRFLIADAPFSADNEMLTPTLKIRRHKIGAVYGDRLTALYG